MMPWLHMFCCMLVIQHKSFISGAVWNQAIVEWKCLIQDPSLDSFFKEVKTQYKMKLNISVVFILPVALGFAVLPSSLCGCVHRSSESPLLQLSRCCMYIAKAAYSSTAYLATTGHDWRICSGVTSTWRKYSRLPIRTKIHFVCCFLLSLSHTDHIDRSWKLQTGKKKKKDKRVQCFPQCSGTIH